MATEGQRLVTSQTKQFNTLLGKQKAEQQGLFGQYSTTSAGQEKLPALYERLNTEMGIPELNKQAQVFKDQIYSTKDLLDRLNDDIQSRNSGTMTTESQYRRQIAAESQPLQTTLSRLGTGLQPVSDLIQSGQQQLSTVLPLYMQQQEKELKPVEMQINALGDRFSREITGFTTNKQNELTTLMDKIQRQRELSDREWQRAQDLAKEEREFARQKSLAKINLDQYLGKDKKTYVGNDDFRGRLAYLAGQGNSDARIALKYSGNDARYDGMVNSQAEYDALKRAGVRGNYTSLRVGTSSPGVRLGVSKPQSTARLRVGY